LKGRYARFFAAAHAGADVEQTFRFAILHATARVVEQRVAAVNDDVAGRKMRDELLDEIVHRLARFDEHHHAARQFELETISSIECAPRTFVPFASFARNASTSRWCGCKRRR